VRLGWSIGLSRHWGDKKTPYFPREKRKVCRSKPSGKGPNQAHYAFIHGIHLSCAHTFSHPVQCHLFTLLKGTSVALVCRFASGWMLRELCAVYQGSVKASWKIKLKRQIFLRSHERNVTFMCWYFWKMLKKSKSVWSCQTLYIKESSRP